MKQLVISTPNKATLQMKLLHLEKKFKNKAREENLEIITQKIRLQGGCHWKNPWYTYNEIGWADWFTSNIWIKFEVKQERKSIAFQVKHHESSYEGNVN